MPRKPAVTLAATLLVLAAAGSARAESTFRAEFDITAVSDYRFRGVSLSDKNPALQVSATLSHASGFYGGVFASTLADNGGSDLEADIVVGFARDWNGISFDISANRYGYPGTEGFDYVEFLGRVERPAGSATLGLTLGYVPAQGSTGDEDNTYLGADLSMPLADTPFTLTASAGAENGAFGDNKIDWSLGATTQFHGMTVGLAYVGANTDDEPLAEGGLVLSIGASF